MVLNPVDLKPILSHDDDSTTYTAATTPETVAADLPDDGDPLYDAEPSSSFLVPWPGSTFTIRSVSCGRVLTLRDGQIELTQPPLLGGRGSIYWACVETKGWLGFRNTVSGKLLGHDSKGRLCCSAEQHRGWEYFCVRMRPEGGCVLFMTHYDKLWHVGFKEDQGVKKLAKIENGASDRILWEFDEV